MMVFHIFHIRLIKLHPREKTKRHSRQPNIHIAVRQTTTPNH
jgi:hypothetical protein